MMLYGAFNSALKVFFPCSIVWPFWTFHAGISFHSSSGLTLAPEFPSLHCTRSFTAVPPVLRGSRVNVTALRATTSSSVSDDSDSPEKSASTQYSYFRKAFHVPSEWMKLDDIKYLVYHKYATVESRKAFLEISTRLKRLGYFEDNNRMIHDYLHFFIQDLLDKNDETFLTQSDIRESKLILKLLDNNAPDFILKRGNERSKTTLIDVYVGDKSASEVKSKYETLGFFADLIVVTQHDFSSQLKPVLPAKDIDYLYKHFQVFLTEYYYWRACLKLQKILVNDVPNVEVIDFQISDTMTPRKGKYLADLAAYAHKVSLQDDL